MEKRILTMLLLLACAVMGLQARTVKGTVLDQVNQPVIGATVSVVGTTNGAMTDLDGNFTITNVPEGAKIKITYVGMQAQTLPASDNMQVQLKDDSRNLDEVVVIGYGSAQAKDLTSPITVVKGDKLLSTPSASPMQAMQGKVAGVNVVNNGTPGAAPTVKIRGNGSFAAGSPLYVVDGMFYDDITFLNNSDIEDMSVLKDASAAAIYGVRAANGVIIITTKHGQKNQKAQITYNGYVGWQKASNVLEMCNSQEYASMMMEANQASYEPYFKKSIDLFGGSYADSDFHNWTYGSNTDWYNELLRTAMITNHSLTIAGGGEKATYSLGTNYLAQDGIMDVKNYYRRLNFRAALDYEATSWLKVGFNGVFSQANQKLPRNTAWQQAYNTPGIIPVYDETRGDEVFPTKYASPDQIGFGSNFNNPIATANYYDADNNTDQVLTNFYAQINFIPNKLNFKTSYSYDYTMTHGREFIPAYYVSANQQSAKSQLTKSDTNYKNYIFDNVLTYKDSYGDHNFGAMLGFSLRQQKYNYLWGKASNVPSGADEWKYIHQGDSDGRTTDDDGYRYRGQSYFGRLNYDYQGKYLLMFTFRADGSSKYQEKWGYFPSVGAAWVVSKEAFMENQHAIDYLKLRASWGKLGNDHVAASDGFSSLLTGNGHSGVFGNNVISGYQSSSYFSWLKWELVDEWNVGFNLGTLNNRLSLDFDWYYRMTKNAVISPRLAFDVNTLAGNYGKILNTGFDVAINWADRIGQDFKYTIGVNLSYLHNEVKGLSGYPYIQGGKTINIVGEEMNSFYGFKVVGIYQNEAECKADPIAVANNLQPGDFKYEDVNGDGVIDGNDRQVLGAYIPNFTYGINLGAEYKNFDLAISTYGQTGAQLFNRRRALRYAQPNYNFDKDQYENRWHGEGTSNTYPSAAAYNNAWNTSDQRYSSFFVESADYFRIQNITLGYTVRNIKFGNAYTLPSLRFYVTADRPFTTFSANSFTPELSDPEGWDTEVYPLTKTYTVGLQIQF